MALIRKDKKARKMRPPSFGNAGIKLKSTSQKLTKKKFRKKLLALTPLDNSAISYSEVLGTVMSFSMQIKTD